jgi:acetyl-CoA acyltransferase 1
MNRLELLRNHLAPSATLNNGVAGQPKSDDDIVIVSFARTALCKGKRGSFRNTSCEKMLTPVMEAAIKKAGLPKTDLIEDICIGNNMQVGAGHFTSRMAQFLAGMNEQTNCHAVNRLCSSGIQAVANIANSIKAGQIEIGMGGGVESMSTYDMNSAIDPEKLWDAVFEHEQARSCMMPMGLTSENVAEKYGVTREDQDTLAASSHQKAHKMFKYLQEEITPVKT